MATYGLDYFGVPKYGALFIRAFNASPRAECYDYGKVLVQWTAPNGVWTKLRLVRSPSGDPLDVTDGQQLLETDPSGPTYYYDADIVEARRYYYGVFVLNSLGIWQNAGATNVLVTRNHDYLTTLWDRLPQMYKVDDLKAITDETGLNEASFLQRFLSLFAFQLDTIRTQYDGLIDLNDPSRSPGSVMPALLAQFGLQVEPALGARVNRQLGTNAPFLFATKGTAASLENLVTIITGWDCYYRRGRNRVLEVGDSLTSVSVGRWDTVRNNATVLPRRNIATGITSQYGVGYASMTPLVDGDASISTSEPGETGRLHSIQVVPSRFYAASVRLRGQDTAALTMTFYSKSGNVLAITTGAGATADADNWNTTARVTAQAPPTAVYAALTITIDEGVGGRPLYLNAVQFEQVSALGGIAGPYEAPREAQMVVRADVVNEIWNPASQGVSQRGWHGETITSGAPGLVFTWSYADQSAVDDVQTIYADPRVPVTPGQLWQYQVKVRSDNTSFGAALTLRLYSGGSLVETHAEDVVQLDGDWHQMKGVYRVPADGSVDAIELGINWQGMEFDTAPLQLGDSAQFKDASLVRGEYSDFFDGSVLSVSGDHIWEGEPFYSRSHLYVNRAIKAQRATELLRKFVPIGMTARLVFAERNFGVFGQPWGVENYDRNPGEPVRVPFTFDFDLEWRRAKTWAEVIAENATWDDLLANYGTWAELNE